MKEQKGIIGNVGQGHAQTSEQPNPYKGTLGNECYRKMCDKFPAMYYNKSTKMHYCIECASQINDATRDQAYALFGAELCQLDESLTPTQVKEYEAEFGGTYKFDPPSEVMDNAGLIDMPVGRPSYFDTGYVNHIYNTHKGMLDELYVDRLTREEKKYAGKAVDVKPRSVVKRNDPCPCTSGKKFKNCCINSK